MSLDPSIDNVERKMAPLDLDTGFECIQVVPQLGNDAGTPLAVASGTELHSADHCTARDVASQNRCTESHGNNQSEESNAISDYKSERIEELVSLDSRLESTFISNLVRDKNPTIVPFSSGIVNITDDLLNSENVNLNCESPQNSSIEELYVLKYGLKACSILVKRCDQIVENVKSVKHKLSSEEYLRGLNTKTKSTTNRFSCHVCKKVFGKKGVLGVHMKIHGERVKNHKCSICNKCFTSKDILSYHIKSHSKPFKCTLCGKGHASNTTLQYHLLRHSGKRDCKCTVCGKSYMNEKELKRHQEIHDNNSYSCAHCSYISKRRQLLIRHFNSHIPIDERDCKYSCPICKKIFLKKCSLTRHMKIHERKISCGVCNIIFPDRILRRTHMIVAHGGQEEFNCSECNRYFRTAKSFENHKKSHGTTSYTCTFCKQKYLSKKDLGMHLKRIHQSDFKCEICSKSFFSKSNLDNHTKTHSNKLQCSLCDKTFQYLRQLKFHQSVFHSITPMFPCRICSMAFTTAQYLLVHQKTHTRPHKCNICDATFGELRRLKFHQEKHVTVKNHPCSVCGKQFSTTHNRDFHQRQHSSQKFFCHSCEKFYSDKQALQKHIIKIHLSN